MKDVLWEKKCLQEKRLRVDRAEETGFLQMWHTLEAHSRTFG